MSDETGNGVFALHSVSGCYAEVHISSKNLSKLNIYNYVILYYSFLSVNPGRINRKEGVVLLTSDDIEWGIGVI